MAPIDRFEFAGGRVIECESPDREIAAEDAFCRVGINLDQLKRVTDARQWLIPHCESPIEAILGSFLFVVMQELAFAPFGAIGNLYTRHGVSPPTLLRDPAKHCVGQVR